MSLQQRLDAFKADFKAGRPPYQNVPPEVHAVMERATAELIASGLAAQAIKAGQTAPAFTLTDAEGRTVTSAGLLARGPLVLTFYRGVWCPYCNLDLQALQEALPAIALLGAQVVAVSPQTPVNSRRSLRDNGLGFSILSDPGNELAARFGLRFAMPDYLVALYKSLNNELPAFNGDDSWTLPMPARYVIAPDGTVVYAEVNPDYTQRPDPAELLPALRALAGLRD
ncbi:peroxiredoxin-like family protein [Derxia lacustris]|uniref:peroxiredoxin-like family protein n=1 Tax=Derxia lacustris TaxID=764842 RepID=UPI000A1730B8|nr:peroxiredoxin-like family protein [Derxia lacustris]